MALTSRLLQHAEGYLELNLPKQALLALQGVGLSARKEYEWNSLSAESLRLLERHEAAIPYLQRARRLKPDDIGLYINLGWCLKRIHRLDKAIEALLEAEEKCRESNDHEHGALVRYNLACYYALGGRVEEAVGWLSKALKEAPEFRRMVSSETDFDPIRGASAFKRLLHRAGGHQRQAK